MLLSWRIWWREGISQLRERRQPASVRGEEAPRNERRGRLESSAERRSGTQLQLLIVPLALAVLGLWFTVQQDARQQKIEDRRAQVEREIQNQRAEHATLQAYLDQ